MYRLPELRAKPGEPVFVVEGERDTDSLAGLGVLSTTNPGGAGKWGRLCDDSVLHGREVFIIPDNDEASGCNNEPIPGVPGIRCCSD